MRIVCLLVGVFFLVSFTVAGGEPDFHSEEEKRAVSSHTQKPRVKRFRKTRKKLKSGKAKEANASAISTSDDEENQRREQRQEYLGVAGESSKNMTVAEFLEELRSMCPGWLDILGFAARAEDSGVESG